jgi:hypothetical protein
LSALVPPGVVTVTSTVPAVPGGVVAVIDEAEFTVMPVALAPPNFTALVPMNPCPEIVTVAPPASGPELGDTALTVGAGAKNVNWSCTDVALVPLEVVTVTSTVPGVPNGDVAVMDVSLFTVNDAAGVEPKLTVEALVNPDPLIATVVPPAVPPLAGATPVTCGPYVN